MSLTVGTIAGVSSLTMASNTPQQIVSPVNIECAEVWVSSTTDMTINTSSATAAAGFPLAAGQVYRIPLNISNSGTPTVRQPLFVNTAGTGTVSLMFFGFPAASQTNL